MEKKTARFPTQGGMAFEYDLARRNSLEAGSTQKKKGGESGETQQTPCGSLPRETGFVGGARACISNGRLKWFYHTNLSSCWRRAKRAGCRRVRSRIFNFAKWPLQFAKAGSPATFSQQEKNKSADVQRGSFISTVAS
jgi:hypothetical protein